MYVLTMKYPLQITRVYISKQWNCNVSLLTREQQERASFAVEPSEFIQVLNMSSKVI